MLITAKYIIHEGFAYENLGIDINEHGRIANIAPLKDLQKKPDHYFSDKVLLPGFVNAHSQSFLRALRGRLEFHINPDSLDHRDVKFPTPDLNYWHEYLKQTTNWLANQLTPQDVYLLAKQVFSEMLLNGITSVGEFHYLTRQMDGLPYANNFTMFEALLNAANEVGIRLTLIYVIYLNKSLSPHSGRFGPASIDAACDEFDAFVERLLNLRDFRISWAIGAHSLEAVPLEALVSLKLRLAHMPLHICLSQNALDLEHCQHIYQNPSPINLLSDHGILDSCTTLIGVNQLTSPNEIANLAKNGVIVCALPSTSLAMGLKLPPLVDLKAQNVACCLGTGQNLDTSLAKEIYLAEMFERQRLAIPHALYSEHNPSVAAELLHLANVNGATALGIDSGSLKPHKWADFVTFALEDLSLGGTESWSLLPTLLFTKPLIPVRDVFVGGKLVVQDGLLTHELKTTPSAKSLPKALSKLTRPSTPGAKTLNKPGNLSKHQAEFQKLLARLFRNG